MGAGIGRCGRQIGAGGSRRSKAGRGRRRGTRARCDAECYRVDVTSESEVPRARNESPRALREGANPHQQRRSQPAQASDGLHLSGLALRAGYQPDRRVPDVPQFCAAHEGHGLWTHPQHDLDHEPRLAARAHRLFVVEGGLARHDASARTRTGRRRRHGSGYQPRAVRNRNEYAAHQRSREERAVPGEHSGPPLGQCRGHRRAGPLSLLRRRLVHHRYRQS